MEASDLTYGSDSNGLVWGYVLQPGRPARLLQAAEAAEWLAAPDAADDSFLWLHFSLSNAASERWLRATLTLPDAFHESLHEAAGSTRLEQDGDALVAVIHDVTFEFTINPASVSTVCLCLEPRLFVTARLRPLRSVDRLRASVRSGQTFRSPAELLANLLHEQADVLVEIVRASGTRVDTVEDKLLANKITVSRRELAALRRSLVRLQRLLAPEPAALFRLLNRPPAWITGDDLQELRQSAEELSAAVTDSGALVERIKILQEELVAHVNEQANRTLFTLTVVTVLALPINLTAGLFGMNVGGIPFASHRYGFVLIVSLLVGFTLVLANRTLRRDRE
jgi:zinc transporter